MEVFILYIFVNIIAWFICKRTNNINIYIAFTSLLLFFIIGFRDINVGSDTMGYCYAFFSYADYDWSDVFSEYIDCGFRLLCKLIGYVSPDSSLLFLSVTSFIIVSSLYVFIKNYSDNKLISYIMLLSLGFIYFFMSGIRQSLAIAFLLLSYHELEKRHILKYLLFVVIAGSFHVSSLIFFLVLPISRFRFRRYFLPVCGGLIILANLYAGRFINISQQLTGVDKYMAYNSTYCSSNNLTGLFIQIVIFAVSILCLWSNIGSEKNKRNNRLISIYSLGMIFQAMTPSMAEMFRLSMYFSIFGIILLPNSLSQSDAGKRTYYSVSVVVVFILYFLFFSGSYIRT